MLAIRQSSKLKFPKRLWLGPIIALYLTASSGAAWAYRPFDGTDAAVAAPRELEIELQPAGRLREGGKHRSGLNAGSTCRASLCGKLQNLDRAIRRYAAWLDSGLPRKRRLTSHRARRAARRHPCCGFRGAGQ